MNKTTKALLRRSLTGRDLQILKLLQDQGFATRKQLFEGFWRGQKGSNAHHRRIRRLKELKVLEPILGDLGELGLRLTSLGYAVLKEYGLFDDNSKTRFKRNYTTQFAHDCKVNQLMSTLLEMPGVLEVTYEKELRKVLWSHDELKKTPETRVHFPDGLILLKRGNTFFKVAVEVERTPKSEKRYFQILSKHMISRFYDGVIYFNMERRQIDRLTRIGNEALKNNFNLRHCDRPNWIYHTMLESFLEAPLTTQICKENHRWDFDGGFEDIVVKEANSQAEKKSA